PELIISNDKIGVIFQNYPNPFNSTTTIPYYLSNPGKVSLIFYSINGQEIYSALNTFHKEGNYIYFFNPGIFPEGIYFCRLKINNQTVGFQKLIYLK
ncbi:MAG: T9SS type A sorting domain-containing protein, partial [Prolixibacteraceae bacterium]|nr:T9SS type A sorting domain-containing protein [Prolixibacteraceae bacterium]